MDFALFLRALSYSEKKQLLQLIQNDLAAPENETLGHFFQRLLDEENLPTRLRTVYGNIKWQYKEDDPQNPMYKPVKEIIYDDLYVVKGMGVQTWNEFKKLRGY